jgi:hypothetical protein
VNARQASLLIYVLLVACNHSSVPTYSYFPPDSPDLIAKLSIAESDWRALQQLLSKEKGMVMFEVGKPMPKVIEVKFGNPDDHLHDQGGPLYRYELENGVWRKDDTFVGVWNVHRSR